MLWPSFSCRGACLALVLLLVAPASRADPWGSQSLSDAIGYFLQVAASMLFSVLLLFALWVNLFYRNKLARFLAHAGLLVYPALVLFSLRYFAGHPDERDRIFRDVAGMDSPWVFYYGMNAAGFLLALIYLVRHWKRERKSLSGSEPGDPVS